MNNLNDVCAYVNGTHRITDIEDEQGQIAVIEGRNMEHHMADCFNVLIDEIRKLKTKVKLLEKELEGV